MYPSAVEDCSATEDLNCDGLVGAEDGDGDGFGACEECDDRDGAVHPDAAEICNELDDDCDGVVDGPDASEATLWYLDSDGDGYGDAGSPVLSCDPAADSLLNGSGEPDYVVDAIDCDDDAAAVNPGAFEQCNDADDNCNGLVDDANEPTYGATWWVDDLDQDGYGAEGTESYACEGLTGQILETDSVAEDCDDGEATVNFGAVEVCDGLDNNCTGGVDEWESDLEEPNDEEGDATMIRVDLDTSVSDAPVPYAGEYGVSGLTLGAGEVDWFEWDGGSDTLTDGLGTQLLTVSVSGVGGPFALYLRDIDEDNGFDLLTDAATADGVLDSASGLWTAEVSNYVGHDSDGEDDGPTWYLEVAADSGWTCTESSYNQTYSVTVTYE